MSYISPIFYKQILDSKINDMRILIIIMKPTNENVTLTNRTMYLPTAAISCNAEYDLFWNSTSTCLEIVIVPWLFLMMLRVESSV